jgi:YHS domain-containing protein
MQLTVLNATDATVQAGYSCPCGCTPSVHYERGASLVTEGCCCGNQFAVGPDAAAGLNPKSGYRPEVKSFQAPWGERLEAAWLVGPSVHGPSEEHAHDHEDDHGWSASPSQAIDPVCGMTVDAEAARAKGLHASYQGADYFFCGKGCKLDFDEDPERYLESSYVPSM